MRARELVAHWVPQLRDAGIDTARLDAELLVAHALGVPRERLLIDDPTLRRSQLADAERMLRLRTSARTPVAQLLGRKEFYGLELEITAEVLVPRPETELLIDMAADLAPQGARVIDVGTGSGAIALALAARRPDLSITASDVDAAALAVARHNAGRLGAIAGADGDRPTPHLPPLAFQHAQLLGDWHGDVVISNPPYVADGWREQAAPELAHEPEHALYAGADGLDVLRPLIAACGERSIPLVILEHGHDQGAAVRELLVAAGYPEPGTAQDLAGRDRATWAQR